MALYNMLTSIIIINSLYTIMYCMWKSKKHNTNTFNNTIMSSAVSNSS